MGVCSCSVVCLVPFSIVAWLRVPNSILLSGGGSQGKEKDKERKDKDKDKAARQWTHHTFFSVLVSKVFHHEPVVNLIPKGEGEEGQGQREG